MSSRVQSSHSWCLNGRARCVDFATVQSVASAVAGIALLLVRRGSTNKEARWEVAFAEAAMEVRGVVSPTWAGALLVTTLEDRARSPRWQPGRGRRASVGKRAQCCDVASLEFGKGPFVGSRRRQFEFCVVF